MTQKPCQAPTNPATTNTIKTEGAYQGIAYDQAAADYLVETYYHRAGRHFVGCHPRDLVDQIVDRARFRKIRPELNTEAIDAAVANYFVEL